MVMSTNGQFILDLAPRHPIYVELIALEACDVIGEVHRDGVAARAMLEREGFVASGLIDIFDGGPTLHCPRDRIETVRTGRTLATAIADTAGAPTVLLSRAAVAGFRAVRAGAVIDGERAIVSAEVAWALRLSEGDAIRVSG